jgi:hypothetical protein
MSGISGPLACSRRFTMICSYLNRLPLIVRSSIDGRTLTETTHILH